MGVPMLGFAELIILVVIVAGIAAVLMRGRGGSRPSEPQAAAGVQLNCPSCGKETEAAAGRCRHCGHDL